MSTCKLPQDFFFGAAMSGPQTEGAWQRYGKVEEFAAVAAFLCSVPAGYVTGAKIRCDALPRAAGRPAPRNRDARHLAVPARGAPAAQPRVAEPVSVGV